MNIPEYFHPSEEADFVHYLKHEVEDYFVYKHDEDIVGCGGLNYRRPDEGIISWDIIHPEYHGRGIGRELVEHRLKFLKSKKEIDKVSVRTSQHAYKFYEKFGFKLNHIQPDGWAPGFDIYEMDTKL